MSSAERSDAQTIDLARDVPTTAEDVAVLRRLRATTPSWFSLTTAERWTVAGFYGNRGGTIFWAGK